MYLYDRIKKIFDSPSQRSDVDYSKKISHQAKFAVLLLYRDHMADQYYTERVYGEPRLFMGHVDKGFQPGVFVRSEPGFS